MHCEVISWSEVQRLCQQLAAGIRASGYQPEIVVAIGRGGYVPARLVCDHLDIMALTSIKIEHYLSGTSARKQAVIRYPLCVDIKDRHVLIVDDVNDSGDTLELAVKHLQDAKATEIRTAVMHQKIVSDYPVDYFAKKIIKWRWLIYPWAIKEDICHFIGRLSPPPESVDEAQQALAEHFHIHLPRQCLVDIYGSYKSGLCPP